MKSCTLRLLSLILTAISLKAHFASWLLSVIRVVTDMINGKYALRFLIRRLYRHVPRAQLKEYIKSRYAYPGHEIVPIFDPACCLRELTYSRGGQFECELQFSHTVVWVKPSAVDPVRSGYYRRTTGHCLQGGQGSMYRNNIVCEILIYVRWQNVGLLVDKSTIITCLERLSISRPMELTKLLIFKMY